MTICCKTTKKNSRGFTLIEIMVAVTMLAVLMLGGAMMISRSNESVILQRSKRAAIVAANQRMEQVRAFAYTAYDFVGTDYVSLIANGTAFVVGNGEIIQVNGRNMPITTRVRHVTLTDPEGDYAPGVCLQIEVTLEYNVSSGDQIKINTLYR